MWDIWKMGGRGTCQLERRVDSSCMGKRPGMWRGLRTEQRRFHWLGSRMHKSLEAGEKSILPREVTCSPPAPQKEADHLPPRGQGHEGHVLRALGPVTMVVWGPLFTFPWDLGTGQTHCRAEQPGKV